MLDTLFHLLHTLRDGLAAPMIILATLGVFIILGWVLVPRTLLPGPKMLRLAVMLTSGMVFVQGFIATVCFQRMSYFAGLSLCQLFLAAWFRSRRALSESVPVTEQWTRREIAGLAFVSGLLLLFFHLPFRYTDGEGQIFRMHEDMGYFVDMVVALPESKAANAWSIFMGNQTTEAIGVQDVWYHWGSLFLAVGIRSVTFLSAAQALMVVTNSVLNFLLIISAGALASSVLRLSTLRALLMGGAMITAVNVLRSATLMDLLMHWLPFDNFHHLRVPVALTLPYKFEGILVFTSLALWQSQRSALALGMIYVAACSAPHTVAVVGVSAAPLALLGLLRRDASMFKTGALSVTTALAGWATVHFIFQASLPLNTGNGVSLITVQKLFDAVKFGALDSVVTLLLSAILMVGVFFLIRGKTPKSTHQTKMLGWLSLCGLAGACVALHAMTLADRFHVVLMTHALLVMPVGACGLLGMALSSSKWPRLVAISLLAAAVAMGCQTILRPALRRDPEAWNMAHIATIRQHLAGQPVGYFSVQDRPWWIPKNAMLGGHLESRIVRLNPIDQRASIFFSAQAFNIPLVWLPPEPGEKAFTWSIRLARKLGIHHLLETPDDKLPKSVKALCKPIAESGGLVLYELLPVSAPPVTPEIRDTVN